MASGRRFALHFAWDKRAEAARPAEMIDNRFPTVYELRRAAWPMLRDLRGGEQGIAGFLDRVVLGDFGVFRKVLEEETGVAPTVTSGRDFDGTAHGLGEALANGTQTLIVVSLDHFKTAQAPTAADLDQVCAFLARPEAVLAVCPHHYIGGDQDHGEEEGDASGEIFQRRVVERRHHGDPLVPAVQRLGAYARLLLKGLGLPAENLYGLRPALTPDGRPAPLDVARGLDTVGFLGGEGHRPVSTFNAHPHLPHLQPVGPAVAEYRVLARQPISLEADAHPFTGAGNTHFNALLWAPPAGARRGHVLVCDATLWSAAFRGLESLKNFWYNLAVMPVA